MRAVPLHSRSCIINGEAVLGHIRSHGCRDLLVYCVSGTVPPEGGANTCAYSSSTSLSASSSALWGATIYAELSDSGPGGGPVWNND
jgi:hypothetical protein